MDWGGPQLGPVNSNKQAEGSTTESDPELRRCGYKESFVQEYDGIKVYHHQGRYQHIGPQIYSWAFCEYRMVINSECWNIIIDENMKEVPSNFPGSSSVKLTHDFCHVDSDNSDDIYTNFSFVEMGGRTIWPFYTTESFQQSAATPMWWKPMAARRRTATLLGLSRPSLPALRASMVCGISHAKKYLMANANTQTLQGKAVQNPLMPPYSVRDMQALATFANPAHTAFLTPEQAKERQWLRNGHVDKCRHLNLWQDRKDPQLAYARTLLTVFQEAVNQLAVVVENLEQIQTESGAVSGVGPTKDPTQEQPQDKNQARRSSGVVGRATFLRR